MPSIIEPSFKTLAIQAPRPDPKSDRYLSIRDTRWHDGSLRRQISGVHIVIDRFKTPWKELHSDSLIDSNHIRYAVGQIDIHCDVLEITTRFFLPCATIRIFARQLVFKDGRERAEISVSPAKWLVPTAVSANSSGSAGGNGKHGQDGGRIEVFVSDCLAPDSSPRFHAAGGDGQHAGAGINGSDGRSVSAMNHHHEEFSAKIGTTGVDFNFNPPAVYFSFRWFTSPAHWSGGTWSDWTCGEGEWPTDGGNAVSPGVPGNPGNGGVLLSNHVNLKSLFSAPSGRSGNKANDCKGGRAGSPMKSCKYHVQGFYNSWWGVHTGTDLRYETKETRETKAGVDAFAREAAVTRGRDGHFEHVATPSAWLSALSLPPLMQYLRDLLLANHGDELQKLLALYEERLEGAGIEHGDADILIWAKTEAANIGNRFRLNLDYFGKPSGYSPSYSLGATIRMHQAEVDAAARTLLLCSRIESLQESSESTLNINQDLKSLTYDEISRNAQLLEKAERDSAELRKRIEDVLQPQIRKLQAEMSSLRLTLVNKARGDLSREHDIRGFFKIAGALCQAIPVAQPYLGWGGKLSTLLADKIGRADSEVDFIEPIAKIFEKADDLCSVVTAMKSEKMAVQSEGGIQKEERDGIAHAGGYILEGKESLSDASSETSLFTIEEEDEDPEPKFAGRKRVQPIRDKVEDQLLARDRERRERFKPQINEVIKKAQADSSSGNGIDSITKYAKAGAPIVKGFADAIREFQVPQSEFDSYLEKLASQSDEWKKLSGEIKKFTDEKSRCLTKIQELGQQVGNCCSAITASAALAFRVDHAVIGAGAEISPVLRSLAGVNRRRAEESLLRSLYLMVKAHEALLLTSPSSIDWGLTDIARKASELLKSSGSFGDAAMQLAESYRANLARIRETLISDYVPGQVQQRQIPLHLHAKAGRGVAELFEAINAGQKGEIDPQVCGMIKPEEHMARLAKIELVDIDFEEADALSDYSMRLYLEVAPEGLVRKGAQLFLFRSDRSASWSWSCWRKKESTGPRWEIKPSVPSVADSEVLDFLVGQPAGGEALGVRRERARSALSNPPLWSKTRLWVAYDNQGIRRRAPPRITRLEFLVEYEAPLADDTQAVVCIYAQGPNPGAAIACDPPDMLGRGEGYINPAMLRIFDKNQSQQVQLTAPRQSGDVIFDRWGWQTRGGPPKVSRQADLVLDLTAHTDVVCIWRHATSSSLEEAETSGAPIDEKGALRLPSVPGASLVDIAQDSDAQADEMVALRSQPSPDASLVDVVDSKELGSIWKSLDSGWRLVEYAGGAAWMGPAR
ncbi:hypothetical protein [Solimonas sp. SE-A11]|uniref:hypothetical protein n=1 Tax=Solimonas sp. SE-A11 TaxID=3054954 RepID=UPI00259D0325|nr:hypothetical protein [Solimonas sp. SE-A11]MDM4772580.1 hypothetical protein [Solimonas sp. SE-A11]